MKKLLGLLICFACLVSISACAGALNREDQPLPLEESEITIETTSPTPTHTAESSATKAIDTTTTEAPETTTEPPQETSVAIVTETEPTTTQGISEQEILDSYRDLVIQYEEKYGIAFLATMANVYAEMPFYKGLCIISVIDFNRDGIEELVLVYEDEDSDNDMYAPYFYEIWGYVDGELTQLAKGHPYSTNGAAYFVSLVEYEGNIYFADGMADDYEERYLQGYKDDGSFGVYLELCYDVDLDKKYTVNGQEVTEAEYASVWDKITPYIGEPLNYLTINIIETDHLAEDSRGIPKILGAAKNRLGLVFDEYTIVYGGHPKP